MKQINQSQSEYFTINSYDSHQPIKQQQSIYSNNPFNKYQNHKNHQFQTTLSTFKISSINKHQFQTDSYVKQFQDILKKIPQQQSYKQTSKSNCINQKKKSQHFNQIDTIFQSQLKCILNYQQILIPTICKITQTQILFNNTKIQFKIKLITKMKILYQNYHKSILFSYEQDHLISPYKKFKIFLQNDTNDNIYLIFARIIIRKLHFLEYQIKENDQQQEDRYIMSGQILKKSKYLGRWDLRKMIITDRIESFKEDICTFYINNIREIWTRFEIYKNSLILKIRHGLTKTQLAIPLANYTHKFGKDNWLYRIFRLISASSL